MITRDANNKEAAEWFINYMCRPNIAVRNMVATGYTSPIQGAGDEYGNNAIMFPSDEELSRCEAFLYNKEATLLYEEAWKEVRRW